MQKNVIAKRSLMLNQSEYSNTALRDNKAQNVHLLTKSLTNAIITMVFRKYDVTLTISLDFSLRVAAP